MAPPRIWMMARPPSRTSPSNARTAAPPLSRMAPSNSWAAAPSGCPEGAPRGASRCSPSRPPA
eukprot:4330144-Lingulodinium_polyedra.AAC.1